MKKALVLSGAATLVGLVIAIVLLSLDTFRAWAGEAFWMAHGHCMRWNSEVVIVWVLGNAFTALFYAAIPTLILMLWRKRPDLVPTWLAISFALFIAFCGAGHVVRVVTLWHPIYRLAAYLDLATAIVSAPSMVGLIRLVRSVNVMMSPEQVASVVLALRDTGNEEAATALTNAVREANHAEALVRAMHEADARD